MQPQLSDAATLPRERALTVILPVLTATVALAGWQFVAKHWSIPAVILPAPTDVWTQLVAARGDLLYQACFTGAESVAACILSGALGALVAAMLASSPALREMLYPNLIAFQVIPKIALAPLFVIWLGIDSPSRLVFSTFISFFPVAIGTLTGLLGTNPNAIRLCQSLTASKSQIFRHVQVPYCAAVLLQRHEGGGDPVGDRHHRRRIHFIQAWTWLLYPASRITRRNAAYLRRAGGAVRHRTGALRRHRLVRNPVRKAWRG